MLAAIASAASLDLPDDFCIDLETSLNLLPEPNLSFFFFLAGGVVTCLLTTL